MPPALISRHLGAMGLPTDCHSIVVIQRLCSADAETCICDCCDSRSFRRSGRLRRGRSMDSGRHTCRGCEVGGTGTECCASCSYGTRCRSTSAGCATRSSCSSECTGCACRTCRNECSCSLPFCARSRTGSSSGARGAACAAPTAASACASSRSQLDDQQHRRRNGWG